MNKFIFLILVFSSVFAGAETEKYDLKLELSVNGQLISTPSIRAIAGEKASIIQKNGTEESFIDVVATEGQGQIKGKKAILMKFIVGTIKDGQRTILSQPQILALENSKAEITIKEPTGKENLSLSVVAKKASGLFW